MWLQENKGVKLVAGNGQRARGFTLIEVLISIILIGVAIAALVASNVAFTKSNAAGTELSTAEFLLEQIKELTATLAVVDPQTKKTTPFGPEEATLMLYDDVDDFDGASFSPPIDANRQVLVEFTGFVQQVTVENVNAANFDQVMADHSSDFVRVTVEVLLNGRQISSARWIRANY
jgi:prepilin-type N-terminal cleavage/methylation domain-containing protein